MELLILIDAYRRASTKHFRIVFQYFGYVRDDRKTQWCEPIVCELVANLITYAAAIMLLCVTFSICLSSLSSHSYISLFIFPSFPLRFPLQHFNMGLPHFCALLLSSFSSIYLDFSFLKTVGFQYLYVCLFFHLGYRILVENQLVTSSVLFQKQPDWVIYHACDDPKWLYTWGFCHDPKWFVEMAPSIFCKDGQEKALRAYRTTLL